MDVLFKIHAYFRMALASLYLNRLRALLSILGIVFGVMAVIVIVSVGEGAKNEALRQIEQLGTRNVYIRSVEVTEEKKNTARQNYSFGLGLADMTRIKIGCRAIENSAALKVLKVAIIGAPKEISPQVVSVTPSYGEVLDLKIKRGRFLSNRDFAQLKEVCVIGHDISMALGKEGQIGSLLRIENHLFKIVGILDRYQKKMKKPAAFQQETITKWFFSHWGLTCG
jgi:putative ABC transport system permease protein